ncbi:MAG: DUF4097 domain-containing protein [Lachnospiraceae bacterium]|nr:DUF4097 domain-containing protein [Lachnospiraceae bacterium]
MSKEGKVVLTVIVMLALVGGFAAFSVVGLIRGISTSVIGKTVETDDFDVLEIDATSADITVTRGDSYSVMYKTAARMDPEISEKDGKLRVRQPAGIKRFFIFGFGRVDNEYTITIPDDAKPVTVEIRASSGDVTLDRVSVSGVVKTNSGTIMINDVKTDELAAETSSGDIDTDKIAGGVCSFGTSSGEVDILRMDADDLSVHTSSGDVEVNNSELKSIECRTSSGSVDIELNGDPDDYTYVCESSSGDIEVNDDRAEKRYEGGSGNNKISIDTSSGSIEVVVGSYTD